ncbi:MAG: hypothetical protein KF800_14455 [Lysobacter sp.]|nr:hypothetical protein [Lysobacter sp.]
MSGVIEEKQQRRNPFFVFFESVFSLVLIALIIIGLVTVSVKWEQSKVEFVGDDRVRITRSTWWGTSEEVSIYRAAERGWVVEGPDGQEALVRAMPVILNH